MEAAAVLASAEDQVIDDAVAALAQRDQAHGHAAGQQERRRNVRQLFGLVLRCLGEGRTEPGLGIVHRPGRAAFGSSFGAARGQR